LRLVDISSVMTPFLASSQSIHITITYLIDRRALLEYGMKDLGGGLKLHFFLIVVSHV
jgi:hypothetical protein